MPQLAKLNQLSTACAGIVAPVANSKKKAARTVSFFGTVFSFSKQNRINPLGIDPFYHTDRGERNVYTE